MIHICLVLACIAGTRTGCIDRSSCTVLQQGAAEGWCSTVGTSNPNVLATLNNFCRTFALPELLRSHLLPSSSSLKDGTTHARYSASNGTSMASMAAGKGPRPPSQRVPLLNDSADSFSSSHLQTAALVQTDRCQLHHICKCAAAVLVVGWLECMHACGLMCVQSRSQEAVFLRYEHY
jgi:hypothetical protein